jgi:hypothetical protein
MPLLSVLIFGLVSLLVALNLFDHWRAGRNKLALFWLVALVLYAVFALYTWG